jgi:cytochrome c oxidase assembly protein subunit 15
MGMTGLERGVLIAIAALITIGAAIAGGGGRRQLRRLAQVTAVLTFVLVVFGAFVRLNDAGLGCPDWPGCYGSLTPAQSADAISAEASRHPLGPVSLPKAWKEMLHRYLAMVVGCLIVALAVSAFRARRRFDSAPGLAFAALAVVLLQGAFGALTVTLLLKPAIVTLHLLGGLTTLALLTWTARRLGTAPSAGAAHWAASSVPPAPAPGTRARSRPGLRRLRIPAALAAAVLLAQITLGGWVSTNYAAAACGDLPLCQQRLLPPTDFAIAFHPWRELGRTADDANLPLSALTAIHLAHRGFALIALIALLWLAWRAAWTPGRARLGALLAAAALLQVALGVTIVAAMSPGHLELASQLPVAAAHNAGAATLVVLLAMLNFDAWSGRRARSVSAQSGVAANAAAASISAGAPADPINAV